LELLELLLELLLALLLALLLPEVAAGVPEDPLLKQPVVRKATLTSIALVSALAYTINTLPHPKLVLRVIERQVRSRGNLSVRSDRIWRWPPTVKSKCGGRWPTRA
jgi:hypothetical protein